MADFNYEIIKHIAIISEKNNWNKELNIISWNGREEKFDIRDWKEDHSVMGKGISLTREELIKLKDSIIDYLAEDEINQDDVIKYYTKLNREISFLGNGNKSIKIKNSSLLDDKISTLNDLFEVLLKVYDIDTVSSQYKEEYIKDNDPTYGQDEVTSMVVYDLFGGEIYKDYKEDGDIHYYNVFGSKIIDLTSDQFTLYDIKFTYSRTEKVDREFFNRNKQIIDRYELLIEKIRKIIN